MKRYVVLAIGVLASMLAAAIGVADDAAKTTTATTTTTSAHAAGQAAAAPAAEHRVIVPGDFKWVDAPASLPKGAKMSVIHGDPAAPGVFAMRITLPAGYKVPPHWHPADEHVTVMSGEFNIGLGETWNEAKGHALPPGAVTTMPVNVRHFAWTKVETVIQIHAMGPWGITYVNPQDDPRNAKQATK